MKLLIGDDEIIYKYNDSFYVEEFVSVLYQRYLRSFENIKIIARVKNIENFNRNLIQLDKNKIEVCSLPLFSGPVQYSKNFFKIQGLIKKYIRDSEVAIFRMPSTVSFAIYSKFKKLKKPFAIEVVANPYDLKKASRNYFHKILLLIQHFQLKQCCKKANGVSYVTEFSLQKRYKKNNSAFTSNYSSIELSNNFFTSPKRLIDNRTINIIHVSTHINNYEKGHLTLIKVAKELLLKGISIQCFIIGDGKLKLKFQKIVKKYKISQYLNFVGRVDKTELENYLMNSDLMIFPSYSEGLPRVIIEACAKGLPCISSPIGGIPELLSNDVLFNPNDIDSYTNKVIEIISNKDYYQTLSERNFQNSLKYEKSILEIKRDSFYNNLKTISLKQL